MSKAAVQAKEMEKRHAKEVSAAEKRGRRGRSSPKTQSLRKARADAGVLRSELREREEEVESLRVKLSDCRERLKSAKRRLQSVVKRSRSCVTMKI